MDVEHLIGTMIQGALGGGRKRSHGTRRFLRTGASPFLNASTLLTVGGLVWGAIETMQQQGGNSSSVPPPQPQAPRTLGLAGVGGHVAPPPLPGTAAAAPAPLADVVPPDVPEGAVKLVRLMVSAACADASLGDAERSAILAHARDAGAEAIVGHELRHPSRLSEIVEGITDERQRADLYVLAYSIVRADESVSGAERIYLVQLASLLGLDPEAVDRLEREASARIATEAART